MPADYHWTFLDHPNMRPVAQVDKNTLEIVRVYDSVNAAWKSGLSRDMIFQCIDVNDEHKTYKGCYWKIISIEEYIAICKEHREWIPDYIQEKKIVPVDVEKEIWKYNVDTGEIYKDSIHTIEYRSIFDA